ncbi:MAG: hypothetical protein JXO49_11850 [Deltaproteobacteria bacterium]|nr:hypothetical protein [Candidatus Anaeroferrophillus wilburensis]MBN2890026.1 hypothetical protein [Deltaproteobacteria bacterium]
MKCPKCGFTSFDYLTECIKCGHQLEEARKQLNLLNSKPVLFVEEPPIEESAEIEMVAEEDTEDVVEQPENKDDDQDVERIILASSTTDTPLPLEGLGTMDSLGSMEDIQPEAVVVGNDFTTMDKSQTTADTDDMLTNGESLADLEILGEASQEEDEEFLDLDDAISEVDSKSGTTRSEGGKVIELNDDDQIFDLELDLNDPDNLEHILAVDKND